MRIKQEEFVPLADMLYDSFKRDQVEIETENSFYSATFLNSFKEVIEKVRELEKADTLLTQQKTITRELYVTADSLKRPLNLFAIVLKKANLPTTLVPEIISKLRSRNIEGALIQIKALSQTIESNKEILLAKAMNPTFPALLATTFTTLTEKSNLQTSIIKQRSLLTDGNLTSYNTLYTDYIADICAIGKAYYQGTAKAKEYTITNMLKRLHVKNSNKDDKE
ncbi:MAG: hypothetical protein HC854_05025 [Flavobacterium sp.]|nr:hypothetical protein [Flavobacterium sp.]